MFHLILFDCQKRFGGILRTEKEKKNNEVLKLIIVAKIDAEGLDSVVMDLFNNVIMLTFF